MENKNGEKVETTFRTLDHEELFETYGGWMFRGPISPYTWLKLLIDELKKKED